MGFCSGEDADRNQQIICTISDLYNMCGIAGILSEDSSVITTQRLSLMASRLSHRGPDGEGFFINPSHHTGFAHRRLSVIDLSEAAAQPMHYLQRYTIVYNGEIYNYIELRRKLIKSGCQFNTQSDTEVIVALYDVYKERCLQYLDGMFAFAIWDEHQRRLFGARDRFGEKPFYFCKSDKEFLFASEMKALWAAGAPRNIDNKMLLNFLCIGRVHNAGNKMQTFYREISSLPRSNYLYYDLSTHELTIQPYWDLDKQRQIRISETRAIEKLDMLLQTSVTRRLRSDVPIGACLSGGLDSSTILSYTKEIQPDLKISTFSASFPDFEKDETRYADLVVNKLNLINHRVVPTADELIKDFSTLCYHQEEPFPSSSIYAQYRVYQQARSEGISVLLDGQGADEIIGGYHRYIHWYLQELINRNRLMKFNKERSNFLKNQISYNWGIKNIIATWFPSHVSLALEKREYNKIAFNHDITHEFFGSVKGREWEGIHKPVVTKLNDILYFDTMNNSLEELLRYSDRNSMAHGVEVRLPFLFYELVKFILSLPTDLKINKGFTKYILRKTVEQKLPPEIAWRTDKIGYEPPQQMWMENSKMQELINDHKSLLIKEHILRPDVLNRKIALQGAHDPDNYDWRYLVAGEFIGLKPYTNP